LKSCLAAFLGFGIAEVALRCLLFCDHPAIAERMRSLRRPTNFCDDSYDDDYWKLDHVFQTGLHAEAPRNLPFDPVLGWVRHDVDPRTYEHADEAAVGGRRPVLLYGDSFANCVTGSASCWQGLMEQSPLGKEAAIVNYGTGGYGFDQIVLSMLRTLPRYLDRHPIVVMSVLVDGDLERSLLHCRELPKPRFRFNEAQDLVLENAAVPSMQEFLALHPIGIRSYLLRYFLHGSGAVPEAWVDWFEGVEERENEARRLSEALLEMAVQELEASGVEYFFLIFHSRRFFAPGANHDWQEAFVVETLQRLGAPFLLSRLVLMRAALEGKVSVTDYFIPNGRGRNHLDVEGNKVVFEDFVRGLRREFDDVPTICFLSWDTLEKQGVATHWRFQNEEGESPRLALDVPPSGRWKATYDLEGHSTRLAATLQAEAAPNGRARVSISLDGEMARVETLEAGVRDRDLDVDLTGVKTLCIEVASIGDDSIKVDLLAPRIEGALPGSRGAGPQSSPAESR
jgi:hypothetical protein